jgi:hypothetical protein
MKDEKMEVYQKLNSGHPVKLVFQLTYRGCCSEINGMLSAMLYCLMHDIEFILYSKKWTNGFKYGWTDYFRPFCRECKNPLFIRDSVFSVNGKFKVLNYIQKRIYRRYLNAHDIWIELNNPSFLSSKFIIPELGINGGIEEAKRVLLDIVFKYNEDVGHALHLQNEKMNQMKTYAGIHIRRGDKVKGRSKEAEAFPVESYIEKIIKVAPQISNVFIATDDYQTVEEFKGVCPPHWKVFTFSQPNCTGYQQGAFNCLSADKKRRETIDLLIDLNFLANASFLVGTGSSNVCKLISSLKGQDHIYSLD